MFRSGLISFLLTSVSRTVAVADEPFTFTIVVPDRVTAASLAPLPMHVLLEILDRGNGETC